MSERSRWRVTGSLASKETSLGEEVTDMYMHCCSAANKSALQNASTRSLIQSITSSSQRHPYSCTKYVANKGTTTAVCNSASTPFSSSPQHHLARPKAF